jgi:hypothetical protein
MKFLAAVGCLLLFLVPRAHAMSNRVYHTPLVASRDSQSALFLVGTMGPEGGGSIEFLLVTPKQRERFVVSSNFSPGGPSRPQTIKPAQCRLAVARLQAASRKAGIVDFSSHPERCQGRARERVIYVSAKYAGITPLSLDHQRRNSPMPVLVTEGNALVLHEEQGTTSLPFAMPKTRSLDMRGFFFRDNLLLAVLLGDGRAETLRLFRRARVGDRFRALP